MAFLLTSAVVLSWSEYFFTQNNDRWGNCCSQISRFNLTVKSEITYILNSFLFAVFLACLCSKTSRFVLVSMMSTTSRHLAKLFLSCSRYLFKIFLLSINHQRKFLENFSLWLDLYICWLGRNLHGHCKWWRLWWS